MPSVSMAEVIAWQMLYAILKLWQMLLPRGRCYPFILRVADVIAILLWQMLYHYSILQLLC